MLKIYVAAKRSVLTYLRQSSLNLRICFIVLNSVGLYQFSNFTIRTCRNIFLFRLRLPTRPTASKREKFNDATRDKSQRANEDFFFLCAFRVGRTT
jgi:hypothetical protein